MSFPDITYTAVYSAYNGTIYLCAVVDELAEDNIDHAVVVRYENNYFQFFTLNSSLGAIVTEVKPEVDLIFSIDGNIQQVAGGDYPFQLTDASDESFSDLVHLKDAKLVEGSLFVAGMARRVYKSSPFQPWRPIDQDVFVPRDDRGIPSGFLSLDGFSKNDIYAAGLGGEIWQYDGVKWIENSSPTNVALTQVLCCKHDDQVYLAGMSGTVIVGEKDIWKEVVNTETKADFWGICAYGESVYLSNYDGVFRIHESELHKVETPQNITTAYLCSTSENIYSVGHKDVIASSDGISWVKLSIQVDDELDRN